MKLQNKIYKRRWIIIKRDVEIKCYIKVQNDGKAMKKVTFLTLMSYLKSTFVNYCRPQREQDLQKNFLPASIYFAVK